MKDCKKPPTEEEKKQKANAKLVTPPKDGEPTTKQIDGKTMHWCQKCRRGKGRWTEDHATDKHVTGFMKKKAGGGANIAAVSQICQDAWFGVDGPSNI